MEKVFCYSCIEMGSMAEGHFWLHSGLTTGKDIDDVRDDIQANYTDARHIMVEEVPELRPVYDEGGEVSGFTDDAGTIYGFNGVGVLSESVDNVVDN